MHEVLVNRLGGLSLPRKSVVRLTDRPDMTFTMDVKQQCNNATTKISVINSIKTMGILSKEAALLFLLPFSVGVIEEQILSFKSRPHVKELPHPEKQAGGLAS